MQCHTYVDLHVYYTGIVTHTHTHRERERERRERERERERERGRERERERGGGGVGMGEGGRGRGRKRVTEPGAWGEGPVDKREREKDMSLYWRSMHDYLVINVCEPMTMSTSSTLSMILSMSCSCGLLCAVALVKK